MRIVRNVLTQLAFLFLVVTGVGQAAQDPYLEVGGTTYPLRYGLAEQNDNVTPYPVMGKPICIKKNSTISVTLRDPGNVVVRWQVYSATLSSRTSNTVYFDHQYGYNSPWHQVGDTVLLDSAPNKVEDTTFQVQVVCEFRSSTPPGDARTPTVRKGSRTRLA